MRSKQETSGRKTKNVQKPKNGHSHSLASSNIAKDGYIDSENGRNQNQTCEQSYASEITAGNSMESLDLHFSDSGFSTISSMESSQTSGLSKSRGRTEAAFTENLTKQEEPRDVKRKRWLKTAKVLQQSGLLDITIKTADLLRKNKQIQQEITDLQKNTRDFVMSVLENPQNRGVFSSIRSQKELYEMLVPGSCSLMSMSSDGVENLSRRPSGSISVDKESSLMHHSPPLTISSPIGCTDS